MTARREDWDIKPMGPDREAVAVERRYTDAERDRIAEGHVPDSMDDKWFVYMDGDGVVHIHRSWTGDALYQARLARDGDGWVVAEAWADRGPGQSLTSAEHDPEMLGGFLDRLAGR